MLLVAVTAMALRMRRATARMRVLALTDDLTGLPNRRAVLARLRDQLEQKAGAPCAVMIADLDNFKTINDRLGHAIGDEVLRAVGSVLADAVATEPGLCLLAARSHTVLRRQTSIHEQTGAAATGSLRATRLVRKGTMLYSRLLFDGTAFGQATQCGVTHKALVAMAVRLLRRGGVHRSRGWGQISVELLDGGRSETSGGPVGETWSAPLLQRLAKGVDR
jgi:hypothetical protein